MYNSTSSLNEADWKRVWINQLCKLFWSNQIETTYSQQHVPDGQLLTVPLSYFFAIRVLYFQNSTRM